MKVKEIKTSKEVSGIRTNVMKAKETRVREMRAKEIRIREMILKESKDKEAVSKIRIKKISRTVNKTLSVFKTPGSPGFFLLLRFKSYLEKISKVASTVFNCS